MRTQVMRLSGWTTLAMLAGSVPSLAQSPSQEQINAVRSACRSDYMSQCASVPTGGAAALQCLQQHAANVSPPCQQALAATKPSGPAPAAAAPPAAAPMSRREMMALLRTDCGPDYRTYCSDVQPGGGRGLACLKAHGPQLSRQCRSALQAVRTSQ